ncbi:MAG TPA: hypothetical protein VN041_13025 [Microbacterium sp.]|nr:hypothetical protein [Microbacterium sp.]
MTAGEHVVALLAQHFEMPIFIPEPSLRNPDRYATSPHVTRGRDSISVRPPVEFGRLIKERARESGLYYGTYVVAALEEILHRQDKS